MKIAIASKLAIVVLLGAHLLGAQQQTPKTPDAIEYFGIISPVESQPQSVREYAQSIIKEYSEYMISHGHFTDYTVMVFSFTGATYNSSFAIEKDGSITLNHISAEDALLAMAAIRAGDSLREMQLWDRDETKRKQAEASVPPTDFRYGTTHWKTQKAKDGTIGDGVLADTNCTLKRVRLTIHGEDKQDSMMHEMMHVVTGCDFNPELHGLIYELAPGIVKILQENPDLVKYLTTKPKPVSIGVRK